MKTYRLPDGKQTRNPTAYSRAWRREARALSKATGWKLDGFDPDFLFTTGGSTLKLNLTQLRQLTKVLPEDEHLRTES